MNNDSETKPLVVRVASAKRLLDCGGDEVYRKIHSGDIESYLDGRRRLITVASIERDVARRAAAAAAAGFKAHRYPKKAPKPSQRRGRPNAATGDGDDAA